MNRGFTKLFNTIVTSTIWQEDDKTRIVWITMLAIADASGMVSAAVPGLASVANVSVEATRKAIETLESPDPDSRTQDFEGRRIQQVDGGWRILNYIKYRRMLNEEERREYKAKWIQQKRLQMSTVDSVDESGHRQKQRQKHKEKEEEKEKAVPSFSSPFSQNTQPQITKYGLPLPPRCTIRQSDGAVLDYSGRTMDINQVRKANTPRHRESTT
jgi:hypothetical protein